jgi:cell division protein FtsI (penicillin-binding protein 3)
LATFVLVAGALVAVLFDLQMLRPDQYRALGEDQRLRTRELAGYRGSLVDRNGFVLASSTPGREIVADPTMIGDPAGAAAVLAPALGMDPVDLATRLTPDSERDRYEMLLRTSDEATIEHVTDVIEADRGQGADRLLSGLFIEAEEARVYPAGTLARTVVGRVDDYEQGIFGLEAEFNELLQGTPGRETTERGIFGSIAGGFWQVDPAEKGFDLVLTIDHRIQFITEQALIEHCAETEAKAAQAVVSHPATGEILAMANVIRQDDGQCVVPGYNAPIQDTFEPGSVLKILAAAAVIEELGWTPDRSIDVPNSILVGDYEFREHAGHVPAPYPMSDVIARSMNVGTIQLAQAVGPETLHDYYQRFGFAQFTGLGLDAEARGRLADWEDWQGADFGSIAIGQGVTANTVQIVAAYNTLANDGLYVAPRLVREVVGADGERSELEPQEARRVVGPETANAVTEMLVGVVERGTGAEAGVPQYRVAGKTGTAWKVFEDGSGDLTYGSAGNRRYVMSFAGFVPADDPEISIVVTVDEPNSGRTAATVAAPVFQQIAQYSLRILAVPPVQPTESAQLIRGTAAPGAEQEQETAEVNE